MHNVRTVQRKVTLRVRLKPDAPHGRTPRPKRGACHGPDINRGMRIAGQRVRGPDTQTALPKQRVTRQNCVPKSNNSSYKTERITRQTKDRDFHPIISEPRATSASSHFPASAITGLSSLEESSLCFTTPSLAKSEYERQSRRNSPHFEKGEPKFIVLY